MDNTFQKRDLRRKIIEREGERRKEMEKKNQIEKERVIEMLRNTSLVEVYYDNNNFVVEDVGVNSGIYNHIKSRLTGSILEVFGKKYVEWSGNMTINIPDTAKYYLAVLNAHVKGIDVHYTNKDVLSLKGNYDVVFVDFAANVDSDYL